MQVGMTRWLFASLLPLFISCALPTEEPKRVPASTAAAPVAPIDLGEIDDVEAPEAEPAAPAVVPSGTFATLSALCAAQQTLIAPLLGAAQAEMQERGIELTLVPHCEPVPEALDGVTVELRAPYLQVMPLQIETGYATALHLAVRTASGWVALPHASMDVFHDDPGCFTIERDVGLVAVNVVGDDAPSLELVEKSERGAITEYDDETGTEPVGTWNDVRERTVVCGVTANGFACDEPNLLSVARVRSSL